MRGRIGLIWGLVTALIAVVVGVAAYQAGWAGGVSTHLPSGAAPPPYYYGYGYHPFGAGFFPFFGLIPLLLVVALVVLLFRGFGRRPWGWGGPGQGFGYRGGPPPWLEERMREWHQRAHGEEPQAQPPPAAGENPTTRT